MIALITRLSCILALAISLMPAHANGFNHIILADGSIRVELQNSMQWMKADHETFSLAQLLLNQDSALVGLTEEAVVEANETYWLRLKIINPTILNIPLALTLSSSSIQVDSAYRKENEIWQRIRGLENQKLLSGSTALILHIEALSDQWLYFRIKPVHTSRLEPELQDLNQYLHDSSLLQQTLGAIIALMVFVAFLHAIAIRFHNHIRHYLTIFLAFCSACFGLSHTQLLQWNDWFLTFVQITPWVMAASLYLYSFTNEQYRALLTSNRTLAFILTLILISLILAHTPFITILVFSLIPSILVLIKIKHLNINLSIANGILALSSLWQVIYIMEPGQIFAPEGISQVYVVALCVLFASFSMIIPYFRRQTRRKQTQEKGISGMFLENLSHELRTPMNGVLGMAELLSDTPLSAKQRDYIDTITYSGQDMLRMVNRINDFNRVQTGRAHLNKQTIELSHFVQGCLSKFQFIANQKGLELVLNVAQQVPLTFQGDTQRLETIIENLLDNALRHTEYGEIELKVSLMEKNKILFAVRDTGSGIERALLNSILSDEILDTPLNHQHHGFGLSLSKQLIELMGGHLFAESRLDNGSVFSFTLPFDISEELTKPKSSDRQTLQGHSILIVDDNSTLRKVMQRYANSWGMHSESTFNGKEALAMLRSQSNLGTPFDFILIDQDMPIMDGFQLARRIHEDDNIHPSLIKVMLTGMSISNTQKEVIQYGIDQVITKPVSAQELQQTLSLLICKRNQASKPA